MSKNKKLIIIIGVITTVAIISAIFAYLFIATDIFKSGKELFAKYFVQNTETFQQLFDLETVEVYKNLKVESKYESNTNITMLSSEGGEISNPINNLSLKLDIQKNDDEQYLYADGKILFENEEYLESEIIKEKEQYGIRFTDLIQQFITIKDDENLEAIANDIGLDISYVREFMNYIDGTVQTESQLNTLKDKYLNIVTAEISNGEFEKHKSAMITYNNETIKTNAYSVTLSSDQVENMLIAIMNQLKEEKLLEKIDIVIDKEIIIKSFDEMINKIKEEVELPIIKITVFEQKQKTIRTDIEIGSNKISIDNVEQNGEIKTRINYNNLNNDNVEQYNFEISKKNIENKEDFSITVDVTEGKENYTISFSSIMLISDKNIELNVEISHNQNITTTSILFANEVNIGNDFEKTQSLVSGNYGILNEIKEEKRKELIDWIKIMSLQKVEERINLLRTKIISDDEVQNYGQENPDAEPELSQIEINKFNSKFEFYTGEEVSNENVKTLLDIVKNNLSNYEIDNIASEDEGTEKTKVNIKLYIEKDKVNENGINEVNGKIENSKKYKVLIFYKESNGLIDYITITEN